MKHLVCTHFSRNTGYPEVLFHRDEKNLYGSAYNCGAKGKTNHSHINMGFETITEAVKGMLKSGKCSGMNGCGRTGVLAAYLG